MSMQTCGCRGSKQNVKFMKAGNLQGLERSSVSIGLDGAQHAERVGRVWALVRWVVTGTQQTFTACSRNSGRSRWHMTPRSHGPRWVWCQRCMKWIEKRSLEQRCQLRSHMVAWRRGLGDWTQESISMRVGIRPKGTWNLPRSKVEAVIREDKPVAFRVIAFPKVLKRPTGTTKYREK